MLYGLGSWHYLVVLLSRTTFYRAWMVLSFQDTNPYCQGQADLGWFYLSMNNTKVSSESLCLVTLQCVL